MSVTLPLHRARMPRGLNRPAGLYDVLKIPNDNAWALLIAAQESLLQFKKKEYKPDAYWYDKRAHFAEQPRKPTPAAAVHKSATSGTAGGTISVFAAAARVLGSMLPGYSGPVRPAPGLFSGGARKPEEETYG